MNQNNHTDVNVPEVAAPELSLLMCSHLRTKTLLVDKQIPVEPLCPYNFCKVNKPPSQWDHLKQLTTTKMAEVSRTPNFGLKVILMGHVFLISLAGTGTWCPSSYLFYNTLFLLTLLWAIHKNKDIDEPIQLAIVMNGILIILDIILLSIRFPEHRKHREDEVFFASIAIVNLLVRPASCLFLLRFLKWQVEKSGPGQHFAAIKLYSHDDMYKATNLGYPPFQTAYDYSHAQQI